MDKFKGWKLGGPKSTEPDLYCRHCNALMNHNKIKWKRRKFNPAGLGTSQEQKDQFKKIANIAPELNNEIEASPNQIFGAIEYEHHGTCPECNQILTAFWFGLESMLSYGNNENPLRGKPFTCTECKQQIERITCFVYSTFVSGDDKVYEPLAIVCPKCKTENGYPFDHDLDSGRIE